jgi:hypothetical protein
VLLERLLAGWLAHRQAGETFFAFTRRHEIDGLRALAAEAAQTLAA